MLHSLASKIKQFLTAISLLLLALLSAEFVLQVQNPPGDSTVAATVAKRFQAWLAPSATMHHELLRLSEPSNPNGPTIAINSFGLRGPEPKRERPPGSLRVLLLGDETVLGPELEEQHTIAARLQEFLTRISGKPVEVLNGGVPGYCPLLSWLQYQHELKQLKPDVVVLHIDMSDVADDAAYRRYLKKADTEQICMNENLTSTVSNNGTAARIMRQSALIRLVQQECGLIPDQNSDSATTTNSHYEWTLGTQADLRLSIQHAVSPLTEFKSAAERGEFRLLVCCSPVPWQVTKPVEMPRAGTGSDKQADSSVTDDRPFLILQAACEKAKVPFCSSVDAFRSYRSPMELFADQSLYLSSYGAALYAREIATMLLKEQQFADLSPEQQTSR